jgi:cytochrome c oxidase subunit 2
MTFVVHRTDRADARRRRSRGRVACALLLALGAESAALAATPGEFAYCTVCHGTNGNGNAATRAPKLAGLPAWYVRAQLDAFRAGWRGADRADAPGREMLPVAAALPNEAALARAVAYVAAFVPRAPAATVHGDPARGAALYAPCTTCHGTTGAGDATLAAPALAGQSDWYLVAQLANYRDGRRGTHEGDTHGAEMRAFATNLDDVAIVDLVAYIDSLGAAPGAAASSTP